MKNVNQIFTNLRKVVNGSKPNTKYKQIMMYIDLLEETILLEEANHELSNTHDTLVEEESIFTPEEEGHVVEEEVMLDVDDVSVEEDELDHDEIETLEIEEDVLNLNNLTLTELRGLYPDIKATSKEKFLKQINNQ